MGVDKNDNVHFLDGVTVTEIASVSKDISAPESLILDMKEAVHRFTSYDRSSGYFRRD